MTGYIVLCILCGMIGFGVVGYINSLKLAKRVRVLDGYNGEICAIVNDAQNEVEGLTDMVRNLCPHEEHEYTIKQAFYNQGFQPISMNETYHTKKCMVCGVKTRITEKEYAEAIKAIELAEIESDREALEERQRNAMEV